MSNMRPMNIFPRIVTTLKAVVFIVVSFICGLVINTAPYVLKYATKGRNWAEKSLAAIGLMIVTVGCGSLPEFKIETPKGQISIRSKESLDRERLRKERDDAWKEVDRVKSNSRKERVYSQELDEYEPSVTIEEECTGWFWKDCKLVEKVE